MSVSGPPLLSPERPEISDLVVDYDPDTLERRAVERARVVSALEACAMHGASKLVQGWPHQGGVLDAAFVDAVLLRSHLELQRLSEEFRQGERALSVLAALLETLRSQGVRGPYRLVDVGCGLGYVVRWLATHGGLGSDVRLIGCDYNAGLIAQATQLAHEERLTGLEFRVANAFRLDEPAHVFMSTGVIHHFRDGALGDFLGAQAAAGAHAFVHFDIKPSWLAGLGAWIFHRARMREPLARHDGVLSALRAHDGAALLSAARRSCPGHALGVLDGAPELVPLFKVMQALIGVSRPLMPAFLEACGALSARLMEFS